MALVCMKDMLVNARKNAYAVGAFEFWSLDSAQAILLAAQKLKMPVILQAGGIETDYAGGYDNIVKLANIASKEVDIPVALHYDHGESVDLVKKAIDAGFTSVMIDASHCCYNENVEKTCRVIEMARPYGITVESELGILAGTEGNISYSQAEALHTSAKEAVKFVKDTSVDALAIAIGTAHGFYTTKPEINIDRLKEISLSVEIPLVLHGGSGTPDDKVSQAISNGIAKVNICTEFVAAFGKAYILTQNTPGFKYSAPGLFFPSKMAGYELAFEKIRLFANNKIAEF